MAEAVLDEELAEGLSQAKKTPRNFALIVKGISPVKLMVRKKKFRDGELMKAKTENKGNDIVVGVLEASGSDFAFKVVGTEEPGVKVIKLKELIAEQTEMTAKPRWELVKELPAVEGEGEETEGRETVSREAVQTSPAAPPVPPPTAPQADSAAAQFTARLKAIKPDLDAVLAAGTPQSQELKLRASEMGMLARKQDFANALLVLADIEQRVKNFQKGRSGGNFPQLWPAAKQAWQQASDTVDGQIGQLQAALRKEADEQLLEIAEFGVNGVTANFRVPLLSAIRDVDAAKDAEKSAPIAKAQKIVADFRQHLDSDERIVVCDENPFGVQVTIRGTLGQALQQLEAALQAGA